MPSKMRYLVTCDPQMKCTIRRAGRHRISKCVRTLHSTIAEHSLQQHFTKDVHQRRGANNCLPTCQRPLSPHSSPCLDPGDAPALGGASIHPSFTTDLREPVPVSLCDLAAAVPRLAGGHDSRQSRPIRGGDVRMLSLRICFPVLPSGRGRARTPSLPGETGNYDWNRLNLSSQLRGMLPCSSPESGI